MSRNFLAEIVARKRERVVPLRQRVEQLRESADDVRRNATPHRLRHALAAESLRIKVIAEFKRRSPSAGALRADASAREIAALYEKAGACAVSVLTEEDYFGGSLADLAAVRASTTLPVLRKDFIIDRAQIFEAAEAGADAVLLIAGVLEDDALHEFRRIAEDELQLDALLEVHNSDELDRAIRSGASLIGVNNRDLSTFEVSVATSEELIALAPVNSTLVSESGLREPETLRHLHQLGYAGFLIGETLMRADDIAGTLRDLLSGANSPAVAFSP